MIRKILLAGLIVSGSLSFAQSAPAAEGGTMSVWAGAEVSSFNPDWGCTSSSPFSCWDNHVQGIAVFADVNRVFGPIGAEGEARWMPWHSVSQVVTLNNYLVGPRYQLWARDRVSVNLKFLAGGAIFRHIGEKDWEGWAAFVPGATVGYRFSPRLMFRADYEYQRWPGFVGVLGKHGLTPNGLSVGVSYRLLR